MHNIGKIYADWTSNQTPNQKYFAYLFSPLNSYLYPFDGVPITLCSQSLLYRMSGMSNGSGTRYFKGPKKLIYPIFELNNKKYNIFSFWLVGIVWFFSLIIIQSR